jgi:hypothetical protein
VSGTTTTKVVTGPSYSKTYLLDNASSFAVTFKASGQTGVSISPGEKVYVYYNATDYVKVGGGGITYGAVKTTTYTAVSNDGVLTNTTGGAFTVNLPATPLTGTQVFIADSAGTWGTNNLTIGRNGSTIAGSATDLVCDINSVSIQCIYDGTTWDIFAQIGANDTAVVTLNGTQTLTNKTLTAPTITSPTVTGTGTIAAATVTLSSTLSVTGVSTLTGGAVIQGLTVGRGAGAVSTNTAVGASALAAVTSAAKTTAVGSNVLSALTSGANNTAIGTDTASTMTTGANNVAMGVGTLYANNGSSNVGVGMEALRFNTTASSNTAVGYQAAYSNTTGALNTTMGRSSLYSNTTGAQNSAVGYETMFANTTGGNNTAFGQQALAANTTASNNTAVGYQAGYVSTGADNTFIGKGAGLADTTGNTNLFLGSGSGSLITTGSKNSILGGYNGNGGGLDIRTSSNYVVLSDGDGNIVFYTARPSGTAYSWALPGATSIYQGAGITFPATQSASSDANTLDDYEEGTWTPVITDGTNNATMAVGNGATYTKIGRSVTVNGCCFTSSLGSVTSIVRISGLPFAAGSTNNFYGGGACVPEQINITAGQSIVVVPNASTTNLLLKIYNSTDGVTNMTPTQWSADGFTLFSCTYFV